MSQPLSPRRLLAAAVLGAAVLPALPGTASAVTVQLGQSDQPSAPLFIDDFSSEVNAVTVSYGGGAYTITDAAGVDTFPGSGCVVLDGGATNTARCTAPAGKTITSVNADLGDGDDGLTVSTALPTVTQHGQVGPISFSVDGGAGDDTLTGGPSGESFEGGADADTISAGDGSDTVRSYAADGDDVIDLGTQPDEAGADSMLYAAGYPGGPARSAAIVASLSSTSADNVSIGSEKDTLTGAEMLVTGGGADQVFGGDAGETLFGGDGADYLAGGGGADYVAGEGDADRLFGGGGDDTVDVRSGEAPAVADTAADLACDLGGPPNGTADVFVGDGLNARPADCEILSARFTGTPAI